MPKAGDTRANAPAPSQPTTRERGNWGGVQDDGRDKGLPGGAAPVQADLGMMRGYTGLRDMVDRGGPGKAAPGGQFSGAGPISTAANFIAGGGILGLLGRGLAGLDGLRNPNYVPGTLPPEFQPGYRDNDGPSPQPQEEEEEAVTPTPTPTTPYVPPVRPPVEVPTMYEPYTGGLPTLAPTVDLGFPDMQGNFDPYYLAAMSGSPLGFQEGGSVGQDADPGIMGRIDQVFGGIFGLPGRLLGREEERSMDLDAQIAEIQARVDAGEITQGVADSVIANLMLRGEDEGGRTAMGLLNISDYLMNTEPDFPSSLPTTVVRGSGGAGTSAIGRLGVRPLA